MAQAASLMASAPQVDRDHRASAQDTEPKASGEPGDARRRPAQGRVSQEEPLCDAS